MSPTTTLRRGSALTALTAAALATATAFSGAAQAATATWTITPTPSDPPAANVVLNDVEVLAAADVWAVGGLSTDAPGGQALHWDGTSWSATTTPADTILSAVEADGNGRLWAYGDIWNDVHRGKPVALTWDGAQWIDTGMPFPDNADQSFDFGDLEVTDDGEVWLSGALYRKTDATPYLLHWTGSEWESFERKIPKDAVDAYLTEIKPVGDTLYAAGWKKVFDPAMGMYATVATFQSFDGEDWTDLAPADTKVPSVWISDLAVDPVSGLLTAAGHDIAPDGLSSTPFLSTWDGTGWTQTRLPDIDTTVNSMAFDGAGHAVLVGSGYDSLLPHVLYFDGSEWTEVKAPWGAENGTYLVSAEFVPGTADLWVVGAVPFENGRPNGNMIARGTIA